MHKMHTFLVTMYLLGGLFLMISTPWNTLTGAVRAPILTTNAALSPAEDVVVAPVEATAAAARATATKQFAIGVLLFTLGGFMHAYGQLHHERRVHISVKKKKPELLYWLEMKL